MNDKLNEDALTALKIAFCYMPKAMDVNRYDYGDNVDKVLTDIQIVREMLLQNDVDPDEVYADMNPDSAPNSSY